MNPNQQKKVARVLASIMVSLMIFSIVAQALMFANV